jgi:Tol biopolymer transport system component
MAPAWSPDDSQIAFIRLVDTSHGVRRGDVHVVRPDGTIPLRLTADSTVKYDVHWNRNGTAIFYADLVVTAACSVRSLWELNPATMVRTKVCEGLTGSFSLNPAGDSAVFDGAGTTSSDGDLTLIDLAARMTASLSTGLQHPRSPDWSPDGKWIAFDAGPDSARSLWVTRTSGGIPISLHSDGRSPVWSPDGKRLAYIRDDYGYKDRYHIWVGDILFRSVDTTPGTLDTRR